MNNTDKLKISQNIAVIAGIFCTAVAMLLLLNFWQISKTDPIESEALEALVQRLKQESNNEELKVEIRNFDLLARKAYFNSQWQVKTGAYLLLIGAIVLAFALRVYYSAKSKIEVPDEKLENEIARMKNESPNAQLNVLNSLNMLKAFQNGATAYDLEVC